MGCESVYSIGSMVDDNFCSFLHFPGPAYLLNGSIWRSADGFKRLVASILVGKVGLLFLFGQVLAPKSTF